MNVRVAERVGERIRALRNRAGLSQTELGDRVGCAQGTISQWESGKREPGLDELVALSSAFGVDVGELFAGAAPPRPKLVLRAELEGLLREQVIAQVEAFAAAAERKRPPRAVLEVTERDPRAAARALLAAGSAERAPIRVEALVRRCGLRLVGWEFDDDLSGLLLELESGPVIGYNAGHTPRRRRFSIAHELGHHVLGHRKPFHVDLAIETTWHGDPPGQDWHDERQANAFAAELLMPEQLVRAAAIERPDPRWLARTFGVSDQAMGFRLVALGLS